MGTEDFCRINSKRTIHKNRYCRYPVLVEKFMKNINKQLCSSHSECRNNNFPITIKYFIYNSCYLFLNFMSFRMKPVSVRTLHNKNIKIIKYDWIFYNRHFGSSQISGKTESGKFSVFSD